MSPSITVNALSEALRTERVHLIDVREEAEFEQFRIEQARSIPLSQLKKRQSEFDKNQSFAMICLGGIRGAKAVSKMQSLGFHNVSNVEGGMQAWQNAGLPTLTSIKKRLPLMQQVQLTIGLTLNASVILSLFTSPLFMIIPALIGLGLILAGSTGWCGLAILLAKMPWNKCDVKSTCTI